MKKWKIKFANYWIWKKNEARSFSFFAFIQSKEYAGICFCNFGVAFQDRQVLETQKAREQEQKKKQITPLAMNDVAVIRGHLYQVTYEHKTKNRVSMQLLGRV